MATVSDIFSVVGLEKNGSGPDTGCFFNGVNCSYEYRSCKPVQCSQCCISNVGTGYTDDSAVFVLISAIIVFFMKAGFMLLESSFTEADEEKRQIIIMKNTDVFASTFGYFLIGCDFAAAVVADDFPVRRTFFSVQEPLLWFFKFTFASNAATLIGGCLIDFKYKLRLPVAFLNAFIISGILHPVVTRFVWGTHCESFLSPYRFCQKPWRLDYSEACRTHYTCANKSTFSRLYSVDYAGGGAVHLLGGTIGLILCVFARFANRRNENSREEKASQKKKGFFEWMYPISGGSDKNIEKAALGVLILWFGWFAFNCGSTEGIGGGYQGYDHSVPGRIAVNMIICCASGGTLAVIIASWAQVKYRAATVNANEIANNVLSCLVAISSSCPILQYWQASLVGILAVVFYHVGCFIEYKLRIPDTARVFPVHAVCGLLGMLVIPFVLWIPPGKCLLHATYESVLWCSLELPNLGVGELLLGQVLAVLLIISVALCIVPLYLVLYCIPVKRLGGFLATILFLNYKNKRPQLVFAGNLLFSGPEERESPTSIPQPVNPNLRNKPSNISPDPGAPSSLTLKSAPNKSNTLTSSVTKEGPGTGSKSSSKIGRLTDPVRRFTQRQVVEVEIHQEMTPLSKSLSGDSLDSIKEPEYLV